MHGGGSIGARAGVGRRASIPAPVMGWNTRDPLSGMNPQYGVVLDNYFPGRGRVALRQGYQSHATGAGTGAVETLFSFVSGAVSKLFGFGSGKIYDCSAAGAATQLATGNASNRWQCVNFGGHGIMVNGADAPKVVDTTGAIIAHTFTVASGRTLTLADLFRVLPFKERLFFLEKDTAHLWYGPISGIGGGLNKIDLDRVHPSGGNAVALGTITLDGGSGVDDLLAIFMSSGDVLIYQGTNPASAAAWGLQGVYHIGPAVGDRPTLKLGPDTVVITADGYVPLLPFLRANRSETNLALSDRIASEVTEAVRTFGDNFGWQAVLYPRGNWLLFNVPEVEGQYAVQHVMNTQTRAWCRFTDMPASCWEVHGGRLYFGAPAGTVYLADEGGTDAGANIKGVAQTAFRYIGGPRHKRFALCRPLVASDSAVQIGLGAAVDFQEARPAIVARPSIVVPGTRWDTAPWDSFKWAAGNTLLREWQSIHQEGAAVSIAISTETSNALLLNWYASEVLYEPAAVL